MKTDLYNKSIHTLELGKVLAMLASHAVSDGAKAAAEALLPSRTLSEVAPLLEETTDARKLAGLRGSPSFTPLRDVTSALARADLGGSLTMRELLDVAALLRSTRVVRDYISDDSKAMKTCLDHYFDALLPNKFFEEKLVNSILSEDEISDAASPALSDIRRKIRSAHARIREILQKMITSPAHSRHLQENIITLRSDRYVVPVKNEYRGEVPGLVHDVSSSGATVFIEPLAVVEANNEIAALGAKEKKEIERILAELSAEAADMRERLLDNYRILITLDLIFARAKLSYALDCSEPILNERGAVSLKKARHPLLARGSVVPIDISLGAGYDTLVITGPNTGGKTVSLKTLGLLTLMAACGLHIPCASGSEAAVFTSVYADIGDEQSIEQSLSTFSSHMVNIVGILDEADDKSLILLDELGAGTDPAEGAALAVAIIERARAYGARVAATTHYAELKVYALNTRGVENAACEFDVETLRPTYRLLTGVPGKSNAFAISARLGLPGDIIENARGHVDSASKKLEDVLEGLEARRQHMEAESAKAETARRDAQEAARRMEELEARLSSEREKLMAKARADAARLVDEARRETEDIYAQLEELRKKLTASPGAENLGEARAEMNKRLNELDKKTLRMPEPKRAEPPSRPLRAGDTVELINMGVTGTVLEPPDSDGDLSVRAGIMKVSVKSEEVRLVAEKPKKTSPAPVTAGFKSVSASTELDLRGMASDEAIIELERFIDEASRSKLPSVTVIHGKGTGTLRSAVHAKLKGHPLVSSFRLGRYGEGETGVTIVDL